jgi:hypothetical protein
MSTMTRDEATPVQAADFYLGPPQNGEYLGTTPDGHPDQLDVWSAFQSLDEQLYDETSYRATVADIATVTDWPHKHDSSNGTPWAYCWMPPAEVSGLWKPGVLVVHYYGRKMAEITANLFHIPPGARADAPRMRPGVLFASHRAKVTR